jgi:multidrug efflux pump
VKSFTDIFIQRPVLAIVVNLAIIIAGLQAYFFTLSVRQYPRSDNASITINTVYIGADAELVRGFITTPIERSIAAADGIDYIQSQSSLGLSSITVRLKLNYDPLKALSEITTLVNQVRGDLPPEAEFPIINVQSADSEFASAYLSFNSTELLPNEITDYLVRVVQPRLSALAGVQRAEIMGARTFAMRIWLKSDRMAALNISPAEVRAVLAANNYLSALGRTKGALVQVNLTANTAIRSVDEFKRLAIRERDGAIVRLGDIADVVLGAEDYDAEVRFNGETAVFIGVFPLPNANTLDVIAAVRSELDAIKRDLPRGLDTFIAYDGTEYINNAIHEVYRTLADTLLIVILVIFLFLGTLRSVIVPVVAIPLSLVGAVFLMQVFGFTINLLSLLAIVLSVGLVVDDAIVVVENVERHLRTGKTALQAAVISARELVGPIVAMTITLVAVYLPVGLQGGLTGSLFREFAFTLAGAVTISGVVALTLSPMMASRLLRPDESERGFARVSTLVFEKFRAAYSHTLAGILRARGVIYALWVLIAALGVFMVANTPAELAPSEDEGFIIGFAEQPPNATIDQLSPLGGAVYDAFKASPETDFVFQVTAPSMMFAGLVTKPWDRRDRTVAQILPEIQERAAAIPGVNMNAFSPPALPGGGIFPIEFVIASTTDTRELLEFATQIQQKAAASGKFLFPPSIDVKYDQPQAEFILDRDKVAALGLNLQQVGADIGAAIGGNYVNRFNIEGRGYKVIPQVRRVERLTPGQLQDIHVTGPGGKLIPLGAIATVENKTVPRSLNRFQQLNAVTIQGMTSVSLDEGLRLLENAAREILPEGCFIDYTGESRQLRKEGGSAKFWQTLGFAAVLIFLVLAAQFNSFRDPVVILFGSVPLAIFGAGLFMFARFPVPQLHFWTDSFTTTFNIYSQVGLVTLVGLISKNGILIVEFANKLQKQGLPKLEALHQAALTRLRPVLMTSAATIAGHFPLTLVSGAGAAARNSIGLVLVGGMTIGTMLTLFVVPCLYMLFAKDHSKDRAHEAETAAIPAAAAADK